MYATSYTAKPQDKSIRAFRSDVLDAIGSLNLVDVRSPDEYTGRLLAPAHLPQEQSQRPGHVPTAKNIPWSKAANDDGTFRSDDELKDLYEGAGVDLQHLVGNEFVAGAIRADDRGRDRHSRPLLLFGMLRELPIRRLDKLALKNRLREIGETEGATHKADIQS